MVNSSSLQTPTHRHCFDLIWARLCQWKIIYGPKLDFKKICYTFTFDLETKFKVTTHPSPKSSVYEEYEPADRAWAKNIRSGQRLFNMVSNITLILDLQTLFKVTVHPRPEALWGWRMNQDGLRGGKCSRQVISNWQIDRQTDQYRAPAKWGPNNQWIQTSITFSTEFLLPSPFTN